MVEQYSVVYMYLFHCLYVSHHLYQFVFWLEHFLYVVTEVCFNNLVDCLVFLNSSPQGLEPEKNFKLGNIKFGCRLLKQYIPFCPKQLELIIFWNYKSDYAISQHKSTYTFVLASNTAIFNLCDTKFLKHAIPDCWIRAPDLLSLRLSNKTMITAIKAIAVWYKWIKSSFFFVRSTNAEF